MHKKADENDIIKRGDLTSNKIIFAKQHDYAEKIADIYNPEVKKKILGVKRNKTIFPSPDSIYKNLEEKDRKKNLSKNKNSNSGNNSNNSNNNSGNKKYSTSPYKGNNSNKYEQYENSNEEESYEEADEEDDEEGEEEEEEEKNDESINEETKEKNKNGKNDSNSNNSNKNNDSLDKKNMFLNREKSRFDFCVKNEENNCIDVPKHILNLINKKINSFVLTKYMQQKLIDKIFLKETINNNINNENTKENDEWTKFINDNIDVTNNGDINNNDEFANELDNINKFIFKKTLEKSEN